MKKAEIYRKTQLAVLRTCTMTTDEKLEVLRELMAQEDLETFREGRDRKDVG